MNLLSRLLGRALSKVSDEWALAAKACDAAQGAEAQETAVRALVGYIRSPRFRWVRIGVRNFVSGGGAFSLCNDIYGPEIKMLQGWELLDCCPGYYNLESEQARRIYSALCDKSSKRSAFDDAPV